MQSLFYFTLKLSSYSESYIDSDDRENSTQKEDKNYKWLFLKWQRYVHPIKPRYQVEWENTSSEKRQELDGPVSLDLDDGFESVFDRLYIFFYDFDIIDDVSELILEVLKVELHRSSIKSIYAFLK